MIWLALTSLKGRAAACGYDARQFSMLGPLVPVGLRFVRVSTVKRMSRGGPLTYVWDVHVPNPEPTGLDVHLFLVPPGDGSQPGFGYGAIHGPVPLDDVPAMLPRGTLVAARPVRTATWAGIAPTLEETATRVVNAPLILWTDLIDESEAFSYGVRARFLGIRALIRSNQLPERSLRQSLTDPWGWAEDVVRWVDQRLPGLPAEVRASIECLAAGALAHRTIREQAFPAERRWRRMFERAELGSLRSWHVALRAVAIGLHVQRHPEVPLGSIAFRLGYSGANKVSDRLHEVIGVRPSTLRAYLGWQWMLTDALRRMNIL